MLAMCSFFLTSCEKTNRFDGPSPEKVAEYLYYVEYNDYIPEVAGSVTHTALRGGCSSVRNGDLLGRNLDMNYCECPEFVVRMNASKHRYASIGCRYSVSDNFALNLAVFVRTNSRQHKSCERITGSHFSNAGLKLSFDF